MIAGARAPAHTGFLSRARARAGRVPGGQPRLHSGPPRVQAPPPDPASPAQPHTRVYTPPAPGLPQKSLPAAQSSAWPPLHSPENCSLCSPSASPTHPPPGICIAHLGSPTNDLFLPSLQPLQDPSFSLPCKPTAPLLAKSLQDPSSSMGAPKHKLLQLFEPNGCSQTIPPSSLVPVAHPPPIYHLNNLVVQESPR